MADEQKPEKAENVYAFKVRDLEKQEIPLDKYRGQVLLVVNTATNCGLQKANTKGLNELQAKYKDDGLRVLGFPSGDFNQELSCDTDLKEFAKKNIQFDYFDKIHVNGEGADPLYKYLKAKQGGMLISAIKWNYTKFLVDKNGIPIKRYGPTTEPKEIEKDINEQLKK